MDLSISHHIQSGAYVEIGGIVVASEARGAGIGARLVAAAEEFARSQGISKVLVRSQVAREDAHRFYLREGYERTKTSAVFQKRVR
jgi:GNAT superfamily N-acetyltransferase